MGLLRWQTRKLLVWSQIHNMSLQGIDPERVTAWLADHVPALSPPVTFTLIAGGRSNLTFRCEDTAGNAYVLRRPPLGHVLESAHDMGREHRIVAALSGSAVPVPDVWGLCEDTEVNGSSFYVMSFVEGLVPHDSISGRDVPAADRHAIGLDVIRILCDLHRLDPQSVGLGDLGRREAYLARQLKRWTGQWEATRTHDIPAMEAAGRILAERMPEQVGSAIVHGDYRLGNFILNNGAVVAVLDWELCTLGDPLADLGYLLNNWMASMDEVMEPGVGDIAPTALGGYPGRDELCDIYSDLTGRDLSHISYYRAFSHWRLAAIGQGVYKRYLEGAMGDSEDMDLDRRKAGVIGRAQAAMELLS